MSAARRQGVLEVVRCGTRPSSRVCARISPVQHLLRGVINEASTRLKADKGIMDALEHLRKKGGTGGAGASNCRRVSPRDAPSGYALC